MLPISIRQTPLPMATLRRPPQITENLWNSCLVSIDGQYLCHFQTATRGQCWCPIDEEEKSLETEKGTMSRKNVCVDLKAVVVSNIAPPSLKRTPPLSGQLVRLVAHSETGAIVAASKPRVEKQSDHRRNLFQHRHPHGDQWDAGGCSRILKTSV